MTQTASASREMPRRLRNSRRCSMSAIRPSAGRGDFFLPLERVVGALTYGWRCSEPVTGGGVTGAAAAGGGVGIGAGVVGGVSGAGV